MVLDELQSGNDDASSRTPAQIAAMQIVDRLSKVILRDHPEVADEYRSGLSQKKIALKHSLHVDHGIKIARMAIGKAIQKLLDEEERTKLKREREVDAGRHAVENSLGAHGLSPERKREIGERLGKFVVEQVIGAHAMTTEQKREIGIRNYEQGKGFHAFTMEQRRVIGRQCHEDGVGVHAMSSTELSDAGKKAHDMGVGIHAMTFEDRSALAKKTIAEGKGLASISTEDRIATARRSYEEGKGIASMSADDLSAAGRKSKEMGVGIHGRSEQQMKEDTRMGILARGKIPWENFAYDIETQLDEHHYCIKLLSDDPKFQYTRGKSERVYYDLQGIANELNEIFHGGSPVRSKSSVSNFKYQRMKSKRQ